MILGRFEEMKVSVDPARLEQEMVMLAQRLMSPKKLIVFRRM